MTIFVLGAGGQMGTAFAQAARERGLPVTLLSHRECDVRDETSLDAALEDARSGDLVVNAAAKLGTHEAEKQPGPQFETNVRGAMQAAIATHRKGARLVHLSTDYVFDGAKSAPYVETDTPHPINMYGALKFASEQLVRRAHPACYIVRISSVFGRATSTRGSNFVDAMLESARSSTSVAVDDVLIMSPTYAPDAANVVLDLFAKNAPYGVYHAASAGACSWREFAQEIFQIAGVKCRALPREQPDSVPRPANSSLQSEKLQGLGITLHPWREGLAAYLAEKPQPP